jgi:multidrug efflux pump
VVVQADAPARMQPDDLLRSTCQQQGASGAAVGLCQHALDHRADADRALQRLPGDAHRGARRPGYSTGAAMAEMERWPRSCRGLRLRMDRPVAREKLAGSQAIILYGFAILAVFLCLAALYESWSSAGGDSGGAAGRAGRAAGHADLRGYANDVYFRWA